METKRSEDCFWWKRLSWKVLRAFSTCNSCCGVPASGQNSHTWRPKWLLMLFTHFSSFSPTLSAPTFNLHIFDFFRWFEYQLSWFNLPIYPYKSSQPPTFPSTRNKSSLTLERLCYQVCGHQRHLFMCACLATKYCIFIYILILPKQWSLFN